MSRPPTPVQTRPAPGNRHGLRSIRRRRGVGLLVVLVIVASAFAVGYAMMRSQSTMLLISRNGNRIQDARQAALSGLNDALRRMHHDALWTGADSTYAENVSTTDSFQITYATGDPALTASDPDWSDYPYRVTVTSRGFAMDPSNPAVTSIYEVQAVVRLVPRALSDPLQDWDTMQQYTTYQWANNTFDVNVPARFEGTTRLNGGLTLGDDYAWSDTIRDRYHQDLAAMNAAAVADDRPFNGPVYLPFSETDAEHLNTLTNLLGVSATDTASATPPVWPVIAQTTTYQLYPSGKTYDIELLPGTLTNTTVEPDPQTNPLGLNYSTSMLTISDNVTVTGSLLVDDRVFFVGGPMTVQSVAMPPLDGETEPVHLPPMACEDFTLSSVSVDGTVNGTVLTVDELKSSMPTSGVDLSLTGHLIVGRVNIGPRSTWLYASTAWDGIYADFLAQEATGTPYLPVYMSATTNITIQPDAGATREHFQDFAQPIYKVKSGDDGLIWDVVRMTESPL